MHRPPADRTVLVVDDADADRDILLRAFRRAAPERRVMAFSDVRSAREHLATVEDDDDPAFAIVDINLPGENGLGLLDVLRARPRIVPTIVMSGSAHPADVEDAYRRGAVGFFEKPMGLPALADLIAVIDAYWSVASHPPVPATRPTLP